VCVCVYTCVCVCVCVYTCVCVCVSVYTLKLRVLIQCIFYFEHNFVTLTLFCVRDDVYKCCSGRYVVRGEQTFHMNPCQYIRTGYCWIVFTVELREIDMYKCGQTSEGYEGVTVSHYCLDCTKLYCLTYEENICTTYKST